MRKCPGCKQSKTDFEFYRSHGSCKECSHLRSRNWKRKNPKRRLLWNWTGISSPAHTRAKKKGLDFNLVEYKRELEARLLPMKCELTGIPLAFQGAAGAFTPALDRIDPAEGYVYSNVRVVAMGVNQLLLNWGIEDAYKIAKAFTDYCERSVEEIQ